ncbi:hypothetical protein AaE_007907, partial [Aphanomyces astaci]
LHGNQNVDSYISSTFDPDEAASLVEVYVQKTFSTLCTIQLQLTKADNTESSLDLKWTSKRNQLLLVDIPLKLVYLALWVASFWTAAMAMNVASPFSTLDDGGMFFWGFFGGLAGLCVVFVFGAVVHLRRQGIRLTFAAPVEDVEGYAASTQSDEYYHTPVDIPPVHMRDIRMLETALSVSNEPMITVRQQAILINCDPIRAVIFRDSCLVFVSRGLVTSTTLVQRLQASFHQHLGDDAHACVGFEFSALEAIVATKCQLLADEQYKLAVLGRDQLNLMASDEGNMSVLDNLRMIKNATSDLESQVNGVRRMLIDMLDDDEELHMLHLTKLYEEPSVALDLFGFDTEEVESLLESYLQNNYGTGAAVELMLHTIQNTEAIVMLKLDAKRNYLIIVDLLMTLVTTLVAVSNFFVNAFTMNVVSWLKDLDWVYWTWIAVAAAFPVASYFTSIWYIRKAAGVNIALSAHKHD